MAAKINTTIQPCRATKLDTVLMFSAPAMLPAIPFMLRNKRRKAQRRRLMQQACASFNEENPNLCMHWVHRPTKRLLITRRCDMPE